MRRSAFTVFSILGFGLFLGNIGCADQLSGGIVDDEGEPGMGALPSEASQSEDEEDSPDKKSEEPDEEDAKSKEDSASSDEDSPGDSSTGGEESTQDGKDSSEGSSETDSTGSGDSSEPSDSSSSDTTPEEIKGDVEVLFTTVSYRGEYSPYNVGAVWIESKDGTFLRTLKKWAGLRTVHLVKWRKSTRSNDTDAVTRATERKHRRHSINWDRLDAKGNEHGAGEYILQIEMTEENSDGRDPAGPTLSLPFRLGEGKQTITGKDQKGFKSIELITPG